jgi:hypothetical protein
MMLNPGQLTANQGGNWGQWGQPAVGGLGGFGPFGPALAAYGAYGNPGQAFGQAGFQGGYGQAPGLHAHGLGAQAMHAGAIDDIADDIAERVAAEIADQAATGAAALFQAQMPQAGGQSLGGLNAKRWLNAARITDTVHDPIKQSALQLCRQVVGHLLGALQTQWSGGGQHAGAVGAPGFANAAFGGGLAAPGLAAYGVGQGLGLGQQTQVAQLAPVVAAILGMLQTQGIGQGLAQGPFGHHQAHHGRLI